MKRREFITLLGGVAAAWPLAASAQPAGRVPTIGFLGPDAWVGGPFVPAFVGRLRELGWITEIAAEFVRLKVDVIVTTGAAVPAAKQATAVIPIVFAVTSDPVGGGLVTSLARPGGNLTGLSIQNTETEANE